MPYEGIGARHTAVATKACIHGQIVEEDGFVGTAFKNDQPDRWTKPVDANDIAIGESFEIQLMGIHETPASGGVASAAVGDDIYLKVSDNSLALAAGGDVGASRVTGTVGANNAINWRTRDAEAADVSVEILAATGASVALSVDVDGHNIIITPATNGSSVITSTAAQVIALVNEDNVASQLVIAANEGASTGAGVVAAAAAAALAGGGAGYLPVGKVTEIDVSRTPDVLRINQNVVAYCGGIA